MLFIRRYERFLAMALCVTLVLQLVSCGTIIYPERKGQVDGHIDPTVAILDGLGLLLFIIPGVIAYAVDFATGAIYLPPGMSATDTPEGDVDASQDEARNVVMLPAGEVTVENIEAVISRELGHPIRLSAENVLVYEYETSAVMLQELARANHDIALHYRTASAAH